MLTRIIVAVVLAPFFFWVLLAPPAFCLALLLSGICALASYELLKATRVAHHNLMYVFTALAAVVVPLGYWSGYGSLVTRAVALMLMSALFFVAILRYDEEKPLGLEQVMVCMFGGLLIPMFLSSLVVLRGMEHGRWLVLLPVICAFLTDAGAYFAGVFLGRHRGIHCYTLGQGRGLGVSGPHRYYVTALRPDTNEVVLSDGSDLGRDEVRGTEPNWLAVDSLTGPMEVTVRLRHSKTQLAATLEPEGDGVLLRMHTPARAPTPGQLAVFYDGDAVVGSAWIV